MPNQVDIANNQSTPTEYDNYETRRVPQDFETIQAAVNGSNPRDLILVSEGTYKESVNVSETPKLTIRGLDRNEVILDGGFSRANGISATADDVVVENLTIRNYTSNGVIWGGIEGYRGSYLNCVNNGYYGLYAINSHHGVFERSFASGHPDSGFYVGECQSCDAVLRDLVAENNSIGYIGTNTGGGVLIEDSTFKNNMAGIVVETTTQSREIPEMGTRVRNNVIRNNNNDSAPHLPLGRALFGNGILILGDSHNIVERNSLRDHVNYGLAIAPKLSGRLWIPSQNSVRNNRITNSGRSDIGVGAPVGSDNRIFGNDIQSSRPDGIQGSGLLGSIRRVAGDPWVTLVLDIGSLEAILTNEPDIYMENNPNPPKQPTMPNPNRPPREPV